MPTPSAIFSFLNFSGDDGTTHATRLSCAQRDEKQIIEMIEQDYTGHPSLPLAARYMIRVQLCNEDFFHLFIFIFRSSSPDILN